MSQLNKAILHGTVWSMLGQFGTMFISLISNIILARILTPYEFGQVGVVMFFIILANVLTESGLAGALVRKKEVTSDDYSTVFVFNLILSTVCFILLVLASGFISDFYDDNSLQNILIVSALILFINAFHITQNARLMRDLKFKQKSKYRFIAVCLGSIIGIGLAFLGLGVWALIIMQLLTALFTTIILWHYEGAFFSLSFNKQSFKSLYSFGVNTTLASVLSTGFENVYQLVLGKYFSINQVGLFYQAKRLQEVPVGIINSATQGVVFSSLSRIQDDMPLFIKTYNKIALLFTIATGLVTSLIYIYSRDFIVLLYGKRWGDAALYMQLLSVGGFFYMQEMLSRVIFKVFDHTHKVLRLEIVKKFIQTITIVVGVLKADIPILLYGFICTSIISYLINLYYSTRTIASSNKGYTELLRTIKIIIVSVIVAEVAEIGNSAYETTVYTKLIFMPIYITLYFLLIQILGITNIKNQFNLISNLFVKQPT